QTQQKWHLWMLATLSVLSGLLLARCTEPTQAAVGTPAAPQLPVAQVTREPVTTFQDFTAAVQGARDIEIRPQVKGILKAIHVDEGACMHQGDLLFQIDPRPYQQAFQQASAQMAAAEAALIAATINVNRLEPLVGRNVVSPVELETARATC